jgi:hypothetical protein
LSLLDKTNLAKIEQAATTVLDDIKEIESEISRLHGKEASLRSKLRILDSIIKELK